jgi:hypothetical protein
MMAKQGQTQNMAAIGFPIRSAYHGPANWPGLVLSYPHGRNGGGHRGLFGWRMCAPGPRLLLRQKAPNRPGKRVHGPGLHVVRKALINDFTSAAPGGRIRQVVGPGECTSDRDISPGAGDAAEFDDPP